MLKRITTVMMVMLFVMGMSNVSMGADSVDPYSDDNSCDWSEFEGFNCDSLEAMLTEDMPFECAGEATKVDPADNKLSMEAELAEGIAYPEPVAAKVIIAPTYSFRTDTIFVEGIPYPEEDKPENMRLAKSSAGAV